MEFTPTKLAGRRDVGKHSSLSPHGHCKQPSILLSPAAFPLSLMTFTFYHYPAISNFLCLPSFFQFSLSLNIALPIFYEKMGANWQDPFSMSILKSSLHTLLLPALVAQMFMLSNGNPLCSDPAPFSFLLKGTTLLLLGPVTTKFSLFSRQLPT